jgi:hypothetical protein
MTEVPEFLLKESWNFIGLSFRKEGLLEPLEHFIGWEVLLEHAPIMVTSKYMRRRLLRLLKTVSIKPQKSLEHC